MAGNQDGETHPSQQVTAGRDAYVAGGDIHVHLVPPAGSSDGDAADPGFGAAPLTSPLGTTRPSCRGHAFISYVREDSVEVDKLQRILEAAGVPVWRDKDSLWPGEDWRSKIRDAITHDALTFIVCFSRHSAARQVSYQNEELLLAIEQLRSRRPDDAWLIPVRFDNCDVPAFDLGAGRTLASLQWADIFGSNRDQAAGRLVAAVQRRLRQPVPSHVGPLGPVRGSANPVSTPARTDLEPVWLEPAFPLKVGLLGPARIGKTSLVTALLAESSNLLAGSGVALHTVNRRTEDKLIRKRQELEGDILAGQFLTVSLHNTMEPFTFRLKLDPGVPEGEINIELLDFPGGWLDPGSRPPDAITDWEACRKFITQSTMLFIPVDAALLMEASTASQRRVLIRLLTIIAVEQVARDWAIERNRRPDEPATLVFCPVRCESYFPDNGGRRDRSAELSRRFKEVYATVIEAVGKETPTAEMLYVPVDTIGCVEMIDAYWPVDPDSREVAFSATYQLREPHRLSRVGADDLMRAMCKQLVNGRRMLDAERGEIRVGHASPDREYEPRGRNFFRGIGTRLGADRSVAGPTERSQSPEAEEARRRVAAMDAILYRIAESPYGPRTQIL